jgi:hypothetical protein
MRLKGYSCKSFLVSVSILLWNLLVIKAQSDTLKHPEQFLFPEFLNGKIAMKTGSNIEVLLNYNIISEKMVFIQNGKILGLGNMGAVDTIYLNNCKFIPVGKVFYEILKETPFSLFVQYEGKIQQPPKMDPYGRASQASATTSLDNVKVGREFYMLTEQELIIKRELKYWIRTGESMQSFRDANQLMKLFPDSKSEIKMFIKKNKVNFENNMEVIKLVSYCEGLIKP